MASEPQAIKHAGAFDGIRLAAAALVIWGHSYVFLRQEPDPLARITGNDVGLGQFAVYAFFAISGYLVTQSWQRDPSFKRFMQRRALRILPALIFVIVASFAVVGPLVTSLSLGDYFARREAWRYLSKILIYPAQYGLPGVFTDNPYPSVVNGVLWSLRLEFTFYIVVVALGYFGATRFRWLNLAFVVVALIGERVLTLAHDVETLPFRYQAIVLCSNAVPFFMGAVMAQSMAAPKFWWMAAGAGALLTVATVMTPAFNPLLLVSLPIITVMVARYGRCDLSRFGDYSYGLYLWGFVVQQTIVHYVPSISLPILVGTAGAGALVMAAISWHAIEKRALRHKPKRALS